MTLPSKHGLWHFAFFLLAFGVIVVCPSYGEESRLFIAISVHAKTLDPSLAVHILESNKAFENNNTG